ncbi:beta-ketoacyl synthase N-terminal-like domain-containing protein [Desulfonatronum lacustre]|uniref:beta-ketoacyl synthase N-terminal-like domain-containing protein n=1 Tax=Desulfonatronum lacustre TaxID=66849 RepID=UPI0004B8977C|nr:beta-ketoacyl synthase N-terminal-like domain-containing protein [Desulfonatronum lacustre]
MRETSLHTNFLAFPPPLAVSGIGVVGGFGVGLGELRLAVEGKRSPVVGGPEFQGGQGMESVPAFQADLTALDEFVPKRSLRRVDRLSRLALLGASLALRDAGLSGPGSLDSQNERTGVIVATGYGAAATTFAFLDSVIHDGDACASPTHFSNSVHNAAAAHISILLKITGPCLTVSQFELSTVSALLTAGQWLAEGRVDRVLFGAVDEHCPVRGYCWSRFFGPQAAGQPVMPLELDRQTAVLGEGAAFFVLERSEPGRSGAYGHVVNVGMGREDHQNFDGFFDGSPSKPDSPGTLLLLGADGHKATGFRYRHVLEAAGRNPLAIAACAPAYGSLPIGQAFDLAVAGMAIREGCLSFADHMRHDNRYSGALREVSRVACLKYGSGGEYGTIVLAGL